jgi:hypothetical protein
VPWQAASMPNSSHPIAAYPFLLAGDTAALDGDGQLVRRSDVVHFERYRPGRRNIWREPRTALREHSQDVP